MLVLNTNFSKGYYKINQSPKKLYLENIVPSSMPPSTTEVIDSLIIAIILHHASTEFTTST